MTKSLRIAFDAKRYFHNASGLGNYSRDIVRILREYNPENEYFLLDAEKGEPEIAKRSEGGILPKSFWRSKGVQKNLAAISPDIFHGLSNEIPMGKFPSETKVIVTIHDLIFKHFPEYYKPLDRLIYDKKTKHACLNSDAIVAISPQTKQDIVKYYGIDDEKVHIHYQPCNTIFKTKPSSEELLNSKHKLGLPDDYLLYVSSFEPRKNHVNLIRAMVNLPDEHLILAGFGGSALKDVIKLISELKLEDRVQLIIKPGINDLKNIYYQAKAFVYPSMLEGFGIPVLEAITCEVPVFCSDQSNFRLMFEGAATYFDSSNPKSISEKIKEFNIPNQESVNSVRMKFDEKSIADGIFNLYNKLSNS